MTTTTAAEWRALGTGVRLVATGGADLARARAAVEEELGAIDLACSRFREDSELVALNRWQCRWVGVSDLLMQALQAAIGAAQATGGAVDPTVGGALWVLGYDRDFSAIPADAGPVALRMEPAPGWSLVELDPSLGRVRLPFGVEIDLGSTAKALAADRAAAKAALAAGAGAVLVSLGGDIAVAGEPPEDGWPVLVAEDSSARLDAGGEVVRIRDGSLATSSTQVRRWTRGGVSMHHIIDPATGAPVDGPWRTVTVAASSCLQANTASTAAIVKGDGAVGWLDGHALPARLVGKAGDIIRVSGWPAPR
jgi:thiamine biosynthesis lipoprotein